MISAKKGCRGRRFRLSPQVLFVSIFLALAVILSGASVQAFNQNPNLNWGNTTIMDAPLPPPGLYLSNYMVYYTANKLVDGKGDKMPGKNKLDVLVYTPQLIYVSPTKIGNLTWGWQALLPIINYTTDMDIPLKENNDVLGDLCFGPYIGGIVPFGPNSRLHWFFDFDIYAPIGSYDKKKAFNPSANYWTLEPFLALTLQLPYGFSIGTRQHFTYNFKNDEYVIDPVTGEEGDLKAGMLWHFNYEVMKSVDFISPNLLVGAAGYYGKQLNEDEFEGHDMKNSKEQKFAVGPAIWYLSKNGIVFSLRAYFESNNKATAEGEKVVARLIVPF